MLKTWKILYKINKNKRTAGTGALRAPVVAVFFDLLILYSIFQVLSNYYTQNLPLGCFGLNNLCFCQQPMLMMQYVKSIRILHIHIEELEYIMQIILYFSIILIILASLPCLPLVVWFVSGFYIKSIRILTKILRKINPHNPYNPIFLLILVALDVKMSPKR